MDFARLTAPHTIEILERDLPPLGSSQVTLRVDQCGVCTSEVDLWAGRDVEKLPLDIGHEIAGTVMAAGDHVDDVRVGDRVVALAEDGGGFASEIVVESGHCARVSPGVSFPGVAEPLACAIGAVEMAAPRLGDDVVIIGSGFMGCLVQLMTALKGPRSITVADIRPDALARAKALGATRVVDTTRESLTDAVQEVCEGDGADLTYEVTGVNAGLELAGQVTTMSGKLCIVAYHQGGMRTISLSRWNWMAFQILNAHFRDRAAKLRSLRAGMRLVNSGAIDVSALVTDVYPFDRIGEAFEKAHTKPEGFLKAMVVRS
jgi:threonine dehydrogenase-like Zn-dependent dehydrogenase